MPIAQYLTPDGRTAEFEVPEGTTPDQAKQFISTVDFSKLEQSTTPASKGAYDGAFDSAASDIGRNSLEALNSAVNATGQAVSEPWVGKNTPALLMPADFTARLLGNVGNGIAGAGSAIASPVIGALGASVENSGIVPAAARFIKSNLVPDDPRFTADISPEQQHALSMEAGGNLAGAVFAGQGALAKTRVQNMQAGIPEPALYNPIPEALNKVEALAQKAPGILGDTTTGKIIKSTRLTPDVLGTGSAIRYQEMRNAGATLNNQGIGSVTSAIDDSLKNSGLLNERLHGDTLSVVADLKKDAASGSLDLEKLDQYRQLLNNVVKDNTSKLDGANQDAFKANVAINAIDDAVDSLSQNHLSAGTPQAVEALNQGRALYAAKAKLNTINRIQETAANTDNPATSMRTQYRNLAKQVNTNPRGWTPDEVAAINHAAKTGIVTGALKIAGSRLISGVAGASGGAMGGGIPGALLGAATGEAVAFPFRAGATALQARRGNAVANLVGQRPIVEQALPSNLKEIMKLPPAQARIALQKLKKP